MAFSETTADGGRGRAPGELLTIEDVAALLKCTHYTVRRKVDARRMPMPLRIDGMVRWRRSDLDQWIADGCPSQGGAS
jgi:excisionase family DNA binding protein